MIEQFLSSLLRNRLKIFVFVASFGFVGIIIAAVLFSKEFFPSSIKSGDDAKKPNVLADTTTNANNLLGEITFNVPAIFNGKTFFNEDVKINNKNLDLGTGSISASNIIYSLKPGANISITGDRQNPTISASISGVVTSLQGQSGALAFVPGTGITIDGLTITNSDPGSAQNIFKNIEVGGSTITAGSNNDTLQLAAGNGISLGTDGKKVTITNTSPSSGGSSSLTVSQDDTPVVSPATTLDFAGSDFIVTQGPTGEANISTVLGSTIDLTSEVSGILPIANGGTGANTLADLIALGTDTTGNYVATLTGGNGIAITNGTGEGVNPSAALGPLTSNWNQTGAFDIVLNNANSQLKILESLGDTFYGTIDVGNLTADRTYTFPDGAGTVCILELGNCGGGGGGNISGSGTAGQITFFNGTNTITSESSGFSWDAANDKLGIGTDSPQGKMHVEGAATGKALAIFNQTGNQNIIAASASGTTRMTLDTSGNLNIIGGAYQIGGTNVLTSTTLGSSVVNSSLTSVGTITTGVWNGTMIGAQYGGTGVNGAAAPNGSLLIGNTSGYTLSTLTAGSGISITNGSGSITIAQSGGSSSKWTQNDAAGTLYPNNGTLDMFVGGNATGSAKFGVLNVATNNPSASLSGTTGGMYLTSNGTLQTTANQTMTIGGNTTGDIILSPLNGNGTVNATGNVNLSSGKTYQIGGTTVLSNNTLGSGVTSSSLTSVGALASGSIANGFGTIATSNTITGTTINGTTGLNTGAGGGTQRIDSSGNLLNITGVSTSLTPTAANTYNLGTATSNQYNTIYGNSIFQNGNQVCDNSGNCAGGAGGTKWQVNSNVLAPLNTANLLVLGGNTSTVHQFEVNGKQTGKALVSLNETGNQNILTASASGATVFNLNRNGNLQLLESTGGTFFGTIAAGDLSSNQTYTLPNGTGTVCLVELGNCAGSGTGITGSGTATQIAFFSGGTQNLASDSSLYWDNTSKLLGIGSSSPVAKLDVGGKVTGKALVILNETGDQNVLAASASGTTVLTLDRSGNLALTGQLSNLTGNVLTVNDNLNLITGNAYQINGTSVLTNDTLGTGVLNSSLTSVGALANGSIANGFGTIATSNTITGTTLNGTTGINTGASAGTQRIDASGNLVNIGTITASGLISANGGLTVANGQNTTLSSFTTNQNSVLYTNGSGVINAATTASSGLCLMSNTNTPAWGTCPGASATNYWQLNSGALSPFSETLDLLIGNTASNAAEFAVKGIADGLNPTASVSATAGSNAGNGIALAGDGSIQSLRNNTLTIGGNTTGNIAFADNTIFNTGTTITQNGTGQVTFGGNVDATNGLDVTGANLTVGGSNFSVNQANGNITTAGDLAVNGGDITTGGDLTINATGNNVIFADNNVLNVGGAAATAYNFFANSTAGSSLATGDSDLYVQGTFEADGNVRFDSSTLTLGNAAFANCSVLQTVSNALTCGNSNLSNYWQFGSGAISPFVSSVDTLFGSTASSSARFKISPSGTSPTASVAAVSSYAGLVVDNQGSGDLFAASSSGLNRFVIAQNGSLNVWNRNVMNFYRDNGASLQGYVGEEPSSNDLALISKNASSWLRLGSATGGGIGFWTDGNADVNTSPQMFLNSAGRLGIGTIGQLATLDVRGDSNSLPAASISGKMAKAALVVDNSATGVANDIFTASSSGITRFTVKNNGNVEMGSNNTLWFDGATNATGIKYNSSTNVLNLAGTGSIQTVSPAFYVKDFGGFAYLSGDGTNDRIGIGTNANTLFSTLDVRATSGTLSIASVSGQSSYASMLVDNSGVGDLFAASSSGKNRFLITQSGKVGIGTTAPTNKLDVDIEGQLDAGITIKGAPTVLGDMGLKINNTASGGQQWYFDSTSTGSIIGAGKLAIVSSSTGTAVATFTSTALGLGSNVFSPGATLDVQGTSGTLPVISLSGTTAKAALMINNAGVGDLFTASASGTTRLTLSNGGNLNLIGGVYQSGGTSGQTISTPSCVTTTGGIVTGSAACDFGNATWLSSAGTIYPGNSTLDLLIGGQATASAKFAVTGMNGSTTPFASLSATTASGGNGNGLVLSGNASLQSLRNNTLTLGGNTTGNIVLSPGNNNGYVQNNGNFMAKTGGTESFNFYTTYNQTFDRWRFYNQSNNTMIRLNTNDSGSTDGLEIYNADTGGPDLLYGFVGYENNIMKLFSGTDIPVTLGVNNVEGIRLASNNRVGINTPFPFASLDLRVATGAGTLAVASVSGKTSFASLVVDNSGVGDIFTASSSGLNRFVIAQNGDVGIGKRPTLDSGPTGATITSTGSAQFTSLSGAGLTDCDSSTSKLLWDASTKTFVCGTDRGSVQVRKSGDESEPSTTFNSDNELNFSIAANETWVFRFFINYNQSNTNDMKVQITAPTGATCNITEFEADGAGSKADAINTGCGSTIQFTSGTSGDKFSEIYGSVANGANSGSITLQFARGEGASGTETILAGSSLFGFKTTGADVAEMYFTKDHTMQPGDVVKVDGSLKAGVQKTSKAYDNSALGIISTQPGVVLGDDTTPQGIPVLLALNGRVPVKIASNSAAIKAGDFLTTSDVPGRAMKATDSGITIAKALEDWDPYSGQQTILAFVNLSSQNIDDGVKDVNDLTLASDADNQSGKYKLTTSTGEEISKVGRFADAAIGNLKAGTIDAQTLTINGINIFDLFKTKSESKDPTLPKDMNMQFADLHTRADRLEQKMASNEATTNSAIEDLRKLIEEKSFGMSSGSADLQSVLGSIDVKDATLSGSLNVLGRATVNDLGVTGNFTAGVLAINGLDEDGNAAINTMGGDLKLQSVGAGGIDILAGKIKIDTNGNHS